MLMVIFGAGASYDSSLDLPLPEPVVPVISAAQQNFGTPPPPPPPPPSDPGVSWRPPLTKDLFLDPNAKFGEIVQKYPRLHGILPFLRQPQNNRSVEQQLELYLEEASADEERQRQLLSVRYYLHDLFRMVSDEWLKRTNGVTNYAVLIDQLRHLNTAGEPVCLVSFNYDLLLDHAIFPSGANTQPLEHHFAHTMLKLFKPHGSVDWARSVAGPEASRVPSFADPPSGPRRRPDELIELAPDLKLLGKYVRANATDPHQMFNFNSPIVPAIAVPVQTKTEDFFEWPDSHRKYLEELLPRVTQILIIGWQGKEAHFLKLLREKLPTGGAKQITQLQVVGRDFEEATKISEEFTAAIGRDVKSPHIRRAQGFSVFVRQEQI